MSCKVFFGTLTKFGFGCKKRNGFPFSCGFNNLKNFSSNGIPFENRRFLSLSAEAAARIDSQKKLERSERLKEACSSLPKFTEVLKTHNLLPFIRTETTVIQVNVGLLCNQTCQHCHVEAGPTRKKENMTKTEIDRILALLTHSPNVKVLDTTGGAPELNPHWKALVLGAKKLGLDIIDRCNLTVLFEPGMENLDSFLAENKIQIVASLPCYSPANVEKQVLNRSIYLIFLNQKF